VPHPEVAAQGLAAKPAFETDDMVLLHGSPDRDSRSQGFLGEGRRVCTERPEGAPHRCNEPADLIDCDAVVPNITTDDLGDEARADLNSTAIFNHFYSRFLDQANVGTLDWFAIRMVKIFRSRQR
jgi:hypothetical protein